MRPVVFGLVLASLTGIALAAAAQPAQAGKSIETFELSDVHAATWSLDGVKDKKVVVVAFIGTECPLAKLYAPKLAKLAKELGPRGVAFVGVDSNVQDSLAEMAAFARTAGIDFPLLRDVKNRVADQFGATRTPEVFVLDEARVVRYRGRIDDQFGVGFWRKAPQREDLKEAVKQLLAKATVQVAQTAPVGCLIGRFREPAAHAAVTFSKQVSRVFNKRCVECHHAGDIAPFSLTSYEDAAGWAAMIAEVVDQGRMPPWHADAKVGHFLDERRLSDDEKRLIHEWVAAGAPQGDPQDLPPAPTFAVSGWHHTRPPDVILTMSTRPYRVRAEGFVRYQHFGVRTGFTEDKWVEAAEVMPGNRAVVHHILVHTSGGRDGGGARGGIGGRGIGGQGFLAAYVPGLRPQVFPPGMAKRIPAGARLTFQIHYTPNGSEQDDISRIGLWLLDEKQVTHEVKTVAAVNPLLMIPPKADNHPVEALSQTLPADAQIVTFMPHMHLRGKSFFYEAVLPDGRREPLLDVPHYDFNWQTAYRLEKPLQFPAGTQIHAIAHFDNSENNLNNPNPKALVFWGEQTYEEMMIGYFDLVRPRGNGPSRVEMRNGSRTELPPKTGSRLAAGQGP